MSLRALTYCNHRREVLLVDLATDIELRSFVVRCICQTSFGYTGLPPSQLLPAAVRLLSHKVKNEYQCRFGRAMLLQDSVYGMVFSTRSRRERILMTAGLVADRLGGPGVTHAEGFHQSRDAVVHHIGAFNKGVCRSADTNDMSLSPQS